MNSVVLAEILNQVQSKSTLKQISQNIGISIDEILDGLEELTQKEIPITLIYLRKNEGALSEEQLKRLKQIIIKSIHYRLYKQQICYERQKEEHKEFWHSIESLNSYFDENKHNVLAVSARQGATLEELEEYSGLAINEIIDLIKKAVIENKTITNVEHIIANSQNEEEKNELLLIQQLSDQIERIEYPEEEYIPAEEQLLSKNLEGVSGSYEERIDECDELTKWLRVFKKERFCYLHDIDYYPEITNEEICAGIYLSLLGEYEYKSIRTVKFFESAYEAIDFYKNTKDVDAQGVIQSDYLNS